MTEEEVQNRLGELERRLAEVEKLLPALIRLAKLRYAGGDPAGL